MKSGEVQKCQSSIRCKKLHCYVVFTLNIFNIDYAGTFKAAANGSIAAKETLITGSFYGVRVQI